MSDVEDLSEMSSVSHSERRPESDLDSTLPSEKPTPRTSTAMSGRQVSLITTTNATSTLNPYAGGG